jgi:hypothetical protein
MSMPFSNAQNDAELRVQAMTPYFLGPNDFLR